MSQINKNTLSPMMKQYFDIKSKYPGTLLFFRVGDFYELFYDDAKIVSEELELVLTGKDCGQDERAPMCGVPFHAVDSYAARLVNRGYKVAICEQLEDPSKVKTLVKRDVIRILTPGTVIERDILSESENNYLCVLFKGFNKTGMCFADVSTSEFYILTSGGENEEDGIINALSTYNPKEILENSRVSQLRRVDSYIGAKLTAKPQILGDDEFDYNECTNEIISALPAEKVRTLPLKTEREAVCALGVVIKYLKQVQKSNTIESPSGVEYLENGDYMGLDSNARRNLELTASMMTGNKKHSLLWVLDKTKTAMGRRMIKKWVERPLVSETAIVNRQNAVGELADDTKMRDDIHSSLQGVNDLERLMSRIAYKTANAKELRQLFATAKRLPNLKEIIKGCNSALLKEVYSNIDTLDEAVSIIDSAISEDPPLSLREGNLIKDGYNAEIDEYREIMTNGTGVVASIESREREKTGIPKLKVKYNKVFGYFIEVPNSFKGQVPPEYVRKQTLVNCERYITDELKQLESKVLGAQDRLLSLEYEIFCSVRDKIADFAVRVQNTAKAVACLDVLTSLATVAVNNNYCCPVINTRGVIDIRDGRHPVIEEIQKDTPFVPNDTHLDTDSDRCLIITGPNMAGKSTYMRQTALIVLMTQIGSFVPARSANIGIVDAVFTRVGASDDLATGQSTFMVEMNEISSILKSATKNSLIILDEIGRGTSTYDGMAIARAVLEYVTKKRTLGAKTLFATHYHELTAMEGMLDGVKNYSIAVKKHGDDITFLRRIVRGGADESFGVEVAKLAGLPDSIIKRAKAILRELEKNKTSLEFSAETGDDTESEEDIQYNFGGEEKNKIIEILKATDVNQMTPLDALKTLNDLKEKAEKL